MHGFINEKSCRGFRDSFVSQHHQRLKIIDHRMSYTRHRRGYHLKKEGIYNDQIFGGFYTPCSYNLRAGTKWPIDDVDRIGHWGVGHFILPLQQPIAFLDTRLDALEIFLAAVPPALFPYSSTIACAVAR